MGQFSRLGFAAQISARIGTARGTGRRMAVTPPPWDSLHARAGGGNVHAGDQPRPAAAAAADQVCDVESTLVGGAWSPGGRPGPRRLEGARAHELGGLPRDGVSRPRTAPAITRGTGSRGPG